MAIIKAVATRQKAKLSSGIKYITNPEKTDQLLVSGKDCNPQTALAEMETTKELFDKTDGRKYKHFIQSFDPTDVIDPEKAHELGKEFAEKSFLGYEVLIATHLDKDHIHNHFIVNSVNFKSGLKLQSSKDDLQNMKDLNDRICEHEGLHVIQRKNPGKELSMKEYQVAIKGQSWKFKLMSEIDQSMETSKNKEEFIKLMEDKDYKVNWNGKNITYTTSETKPGKGSRKCRDNKLHDEKYSKKEMENGFSRVKEKWENKSHDLELSKGAIESGFERTKENQQPNQLPPRRSPGQQSHNDIGTDILFSHRNTRAESADTIFGERNVSTGGISAKENIAERDGQVGTGKETPGKRSNTGRVENETKRNIQGNETRTQGTKGKRVSKTQGNRDRIKNNQHRSEAKPRDLSDVHQPDTKAISRGQGNKKTNVAGKGQSVRSQSSDFNSSNNWTTGRVPTGDPLDSMVKILDQSIQKALKDEQENIFRKKCKREREVAKKTKDKDYERER